MKEVNNSIESSISQLTYESGTYSTYHIIFTSRRDPHCDSICRSTRKPEQVNYIPSTKKNLLYYLKYQSLLVKVTDTLPVEFESSQNHLNPFLSIILKMKDYERDLIQSRHMNQYEFV